MILKDFSFHLLDIAHNAIDAGSTKITIACHIHTKKNTVTLAVTDNGSGMTDEQLRHALEEGYSTKEGEHRGRGLFLLRRNVELYGTFLHLSSPENGGTIVKAVFDTSRETAIVAGDIAETIIMLIVTNPAVSTTYKHIKDLHHAIVSTKDVKKKFWYTRNLQTPNALAFLRKQFEDITYW